MTKTYREGATGALLDEYEKALTGLHRTIDDITSEELITIADSKTTNPHCKSVQTILSHIVKSGYAYAIYVRQHEGSRIEFPDYSFHSSVTEYQKDLRAVFVFTIETFKNITDNQLEENDNRKKLTASWGQIYDIEQITEHAILHILRHRRQIEKFKILLLGQ